ncbi:MAG: hypothetical protein AB7G93_16995 [Bdellovibrionales bacterium]
MFLERELKRFVRQIRPGLIGATTNPNINLIQVIEELQATPQMRDQIAGALRNFLSSRDFTTALTETGLTLEAGVFTEVYKRLEYKLLPKSVDNADILGFLMRLFDSQSDASWLETVDRDLFGRFLGLLLPDREALIEELAPQIFMSLEILSLRLAGLGYDPLVTHRLRPRREYRHAFMDVSRHVHSLMDGKGESALPDLREALNRCSEAVKWIRSRRNVDGASLDLTYRLMKIQQVVHRMQLLIDLIQCMLSGWKGQPAQQLFFEIVLAAIRRFDLSRFLGENLELLAFQITEHTGRAGEHYITRSRAEWQSMLKSAAMGGVIVAGLAMCKILLSKLGMPPVPEALVYGSLYAGGFLMIYSIGATLATKQPAMTASTLASSLDVAKTSSDAMDNLSEVIIRTIRSQLGALLGNYTMAFPVAALVSWALYRAGIPLMSPEKAASMLKSLHPFQSLSFFYAAIAGVGLFLSGLLAGAADNWFIFNNVGLRLKQSLFLRRLVGPQNLDRAILTIDQNLGFWTGNASLGFYLGTAGAIGTITGLPIDTRHITFSSASFGAGLASLNFQASTGVVLMIVAGVFVMGLINLAVSFSLSLLVVVKSRQIRFAQTGELFRLLWQKFRRCPWDFVFPPRESSGS